MKCEIIVGWHNGNDDITLSRERQPEEIWGVSPRNVVQAIEVLDQTYADIRASLLVTLPAEVQERVPMVVKMSQKEARRFTGGAV